MLIGVSQIDISPEPGAELSGFAARTQPSTGLLDPLFAKALYVTDGTEELLWVHCDLLEVEREIVTDFRRWVRAETGLHENKVILSTTHTHSGPCTVRLKEAGSYDANYVAFLHAQLQEVTHKALAKKEECQLVTVEGSIELAHDRRKTATSHTDPRVVGLGFQREDKSFLTVLVNYPIHPVALGASNRCISADIPGQVAASLSRQVPGNPIAIVTNGACANLNPPAEDVPFDQIKTWGEQIASVLVPLLKQPSKVCPARFQVRSRVIPLPLDTLSIDGIHALAEKAMLYPKPNAQWGDKYRRAVNAWRTTLEAAAESGTITEHSDAELFGILFGDVVFIGLNGEVFSQFADWIRQNTKMQAYVVGYANGAIGYLPTMAAYAEGGYEVDVAHFFQGRFRPKAGCLELLTDEAICLVKELTAPAPHKLKSSELDASLPAN